MNRRCSLPVQLRCLLNELQNNYSYKSPVALCCKHKSFAKPLNFKLAYCTGIKGSSNELSEGEIKSPSIQAKKERRRSKASISILDSVIANMDKKMKLKKGGSPSSPKNTPTKIGSYSQLKSMYQSRYKKSERTPMDGDNRYVVDGGYHGDMGTPQASAHPAYLPEQRKMPEADAEANNVPGKLSRKMKKKLQESSAASPISTKTSDIKSVEQAGAMQQRTPTQADDTSPLVNEVRVINSKSRGAKQKTQATKSTAETQDGEQNEPEYQPWRPIIPHAVKYEPYLSEKHLNKGLDRGWILKGTIEIYRNGPIDIAFVDVGNQEKIFIETVSDRNRALQGDVVAVQLKGSDKWKVNKKYLQHLERNLTRKKVSGDTAALASGTEEGSSGVVSVEDSIGKDAADVENIVPTDAVGVGNIAEDNATNAGDLDPVAAACDSEESDSDPDVIIENEEEVELAAAGPSTDSLRLSHHTETQGLSKNKEESKSENLLKLSHHEAVANTDVEVIHDHDLVETHSQSSLSDSSFSEEESDGELGSKKAFTAVPDVKGSPVVKTYLSRETNERKRKKLFQRTGKVVSILQQVHPRRCAGNIFFPENSNPVFLPLDLKIPNIKLNVDSIPQQPDLRLRPKDYQDTLFVCQIHQDKWKPTFPLPPGSVVQCLGKAGDIRTESEALLVQYNVDNSEFSQKALNSIPVKDLPWHIPAEEIRSRRDFRNQCVFTIDPATAKDLDDALSVELLDDGTYEVGVHIADVSYFLQEGSELDRVAGERCTSVYLVHQVVPMLPKILCEELCSLNPDVDRLTMSVVWRMTETGEILDEWFGRTVIRSCCKLTYEHAQGFIDQPDQEWTPEQLPPISENFSVRQIKERVLNLNKIAVNLRKDRFENGALSLNVVKLSFVLDPTSGMPSGYNAAQSRDSNKLVEEFMLKANMAVARKIYKSFPEKATLRQHEAPDNLTLKKLTEKCKQNDISVDASSSKLLHSSLAERTFSSDDDFALARYNGLVFLCVSSMKEAKYFCTGCVASEEDFRHYALSVPFYTHFTSPIRRFVDVMVHRTLCAALGYSKATKLSKEEINTQAAKCNIKKTCSRKVSQASAEMFFAVYIRECGPVEDKAMVVSIEEKSFNIFFPRLGVRKMVNCANLPLKRFASYIENKQEVMYLTWEKTDDQPETTQKLTWFSVVDGIMTPGQKRLEVETKIKPPKEDDVENQLVPQLEAQTLEQEVSLTE